MSWVAVDNEQGDVFGPFATGRDALDWAASYGVALDGRNWWSTEIVDPAQALDDAGRGPASCTWCREAMEESPEIVHDGDRRLRFHATCLDRAIEALAQVSALRHVERPR